MYLPPRLSKEVSFLCFNFNMICDRSPEPGLVMKVQHSWKKARYVPHGDLRGSFCVHQKKVPLFENSESFSIVFWQLRSSVRTDELPMSGERLSLIRICLSIPTALSRTPQHSESSSCIPCPKSGDIATKCGGSSHLAYFILGDPLVKLLAF